MEKTKRSAGARIIYIPHGGGPLPLLGDPAHREMGPALADLASMAGKPEAIVVVSAHWEAEPVTITSGPAPGLVYDYYGFPEEAYRVRYPAPGDPALAARIQKSLEAGGVQAQLDGKRGFDHGLFVPLIMMYPQADIPCVQVSLARGLDSETHIRIGEALGSLAGENLLVLGSGFSFHNMRAFFGEEGPDPANESFQGWLRETMSDREAGEDRRRKRLIEWERAPAARYCHPREEHLLPLQVCYGMAGRAADGIRDVTLIGKHALAIWWLPR